MAIPNFAQKITIQEAAEMAVKNNKDIKIGMLEMDRGQIDVSRTWKQKFFTVSYNASANAYFKDIISKKTGEAYQQYLSLSQPLFTGGKLKLGNEISKDSLKLTELKLDKTKKDTVLSTVQAYIDVYEAISTLGVLQKSKEALDENYKIQTEKYNLRMVTQPEYKEAERSLKAMEAQIVEQQGNIEIAKESLGILIGVPNPSSIEIVPFGVEDNFTKTIDLTKDMEKLTTQNTEYKIAQKQIDISRKNTKLERASFFPTINGTGYKLFKLPHYDDDITSFYKALFVYKSKGKYGLMDYNGNIIIEPKFDKVTIDEPELAEYIKEIDSYDK